MSTPMIRFLDWMKNSQLKLGIHPDCLSMAESLIEEERLEIIKAREDGVYTMINGTIQEKQYTSEDYYNRVYKEEK